MQELPDLPRVLVKREAAITPLVLAYFRDHYPRTVAIEVKATKGNTIREKAVLPHQLAALRGAQSEKGIVHKLSDAARMRQPFDAFKIVNADAYVVACFLNDHTCLAIEPSKWRGATVKSECSFKFKI